MNARGVLAIIVLCLVAFLRPMAFASPPDQSWLGGLFDDADYDDVILLITGASPAATTQAVCDASPARFVIARIVEADDDWVLASPLSSQEARGPPTL